MLARESDVILCTSWMLSRGSMAEFFMVFTPCSSMRLLGHFMARQQVAGSSGRSGLKALQPLSF